MKPKISFRPDSNAFARHRRADLGRLASTIIKRRHVFDQPAIASRQGLSSALLQRQISQLDRVIQTKEASMATLIKEIGSSEGGTPARTIRPLAPGIEPKTRTFLRKLALEKAPDLDQQTVEEARRAMVESQAAQVMKLPVEAEDHVLPVGPSGQVSVRVVRPRAIQGQLPAVMYFHGGGWVLGDKDAYDRLIREIADGAQAAVVFVNFTRSPEARYPVALEECYAATKWLAENGALVNIDRRRIAVMGDSAGANLATVVARLAKERGSPKIASQILFYPTTDANFETNSYRQFGEGYFLTRSAMKWFWNHYAPDIAVRNEPNASPLRASLEQLKGLPPAVIITAEFDVLRDEGEAYARKLGEAGVPTTAIRYLGTIHAFTVLNAIMETPAPRAAIAQATATLRMIFGNGV
jgi:acetyl esterase